MKTDKGRRRPFGCFTRLRSRTICGDLCAISVVALLLVATVSRSFSAPPPPPGREWRLLKTRHMIVHHAGDEAGATLAARAAEDAADRMAAELGCARASGSWTWDDRLHVFIYPSREEFLKATGSPAWAAARARAAAREIALFAGPEGVDGAALAHEVAHVVFREWVGFDGIVPLWLDEGVAAWLEARISGADSAAVRRRCRERWPIERLAAMTSRDLASTDDAARFYAQAADLVGFMISQGGTASFLRFCRQLRSGKAPGDALRFAYPEKFRSIERLDAAWRKSGDASGEDGP